MNMKRFLALCLSLCMILSLVPMGTLAAETDSENVTDLVIEELDGSELNIDLTQQELQASDLALEQELVDANGMVDVFIIMEGESIIEEDASAVLDADTQEKMEQMEQAQAEVVAEIEESVLDGESLEIDYNYTWLLNGVAAQIPYGAMSEIAAVDGVLEVVIQPVYEIYGRDDASQMTVSDGIMVGRESAWGAGYTGRGLKIAIIDTGLDTDHQNFAPLSEDVLTDTSATRDSVAAVLPSMNASARYQGLTIDDVYYSTKVAFGFNYSDDNLFIDHVVYEDGSVDEHGTHVAGIAAANKVDGSGVVGVAPDAQLYIMKVFGSARAGYGGDIIAALEDALILGADVVNMSLGSDAGFPASTSELINSVYARVAETNTVLSISAGNNYNAGLGNMWGTDQNLASNPDNSVIGEPGVYQNVMSVASVENWKIQRNYIQVSDGFQMGFTETSVSYGLPSVLTLDGEYGLAAVSGYGEPADYEGVDVAGKVALVQRGVISFAEKVQYANEAGAIACFVYNNTTGEFGMDLTDVQATIPAVSITMADGQYLIAALEADAAVTVSFPEGLAAIPNVSAYQMSEFSAWGVSPDLTLEPDITAPGGNIYSTVDGGNYGLMSGTSMAAPNVSGISAVVMQYVKENFGADTDYRELVQDLLMSTSVPLYHANGVTYSPRSQGAGLANAFNAITTQAYLTVDGSDTPKVSLYDDPARSGAYAYSFNVHNFGDSAVFYDLSTSAQTEAVVSYGEGLDFMTGEPMALTAATTTDSDALVLLHDVNDDGVAGSHDAYWIYRTVMGSPMDENWTDVDFRYDTTYDESWNTDDVQAYLDALVDLESPADLDAKIMMVGAGETAVVNVNVTLSADDKAYLDTYFVNGGYVEGYTWLTAKNGVDLSLPYLAFYGSWDEAPMIDDGNYWDALNGVASGSQYMNILWTNFYNTASYTYPGLNIYVEEPFDKDHIAVSPNGDGYFDTIDDIYTSLMRNAETLTYRYTNMETGEVYYEQSVQHVNKTIYRASYQQVVPNVYTWYEDEIPLYDWKQPDGTDLENNTRLLLEIEATGAYEGATPDTWSVPVTVDLEAPELLSAVRHTDEDGKQILELNVRDNHSVSVIALMNGDGTEIFYMEPTIDGDPDENGYRNYTASFDITDITGKIMIVLGDYALNERYYGVNAGGEGASYGDLVGYSYSVEGGEDRWVSFGEGVDFDETTIFMDYSSIVCAEYVGGYVFAQDETGALYGFRYEDMLQDTFTLESTYVAQLDYIYQDLAYSYREGKLYGLTSYMEEGYPTTEINSINLRGEYFDYNEYRNYAPYQEDLILSRGGLYGLTMAIDDEGTIYVLGHRYEFSYNDNDERIVTASETAHLWSVGFEYNEWLEDYILGWSLMDQGDIGVAMDYLQSMTWDHNTEKLYWTQFDGQGLNPVTTLYAVDTDAVSCEKVGSLNGEVCALFAPLSEESAAKEEHQNLPEMDPSDIGTPILWDETVTMNVGGTKTLGYDLDPWYTNYKDVVWSTSDASIVSVDQNGTIECLASGSATITVANAADETLFDTCTVEVTALDLTIEGIVSAQTAGLGNVTGVSTYKFEMVDGTSSFGTVNQITAPAELNYGLSLATSAMGRGSVWACEYGNSGMIYEIDAATGAVKDVLMPMNGDMLFGMAYSENLDTFAGIMNYYLYVDLALTHEEEQLVMDSYDEELNEFTYHKINMLPYLLANGDGFVTGETGQGASSEIVFSGITVIEEPYYYEDNYKDYTGNWATGEMGNYTSDQTLVLLDNVGRLWYIDEITGMTKTTDDWGNAFYTNADGSMSFMGGRNGVFDVELGANEDGSVNCSVFVIRKLDETPLTDMFRQGTMPRITYHFSDIEYAGTTADGAPMFAMSLYDYWNNGTTNELYLYVPGVGTGEWIMDFETWESYEVMTPSRFYSLGNTGLYNIIASIHAVEVTGGVDSETTDDDAGINALAAGVYAE